jgi:hypothetical protein
MYRQMADNLAWYGFVPQYTAAAALDPPYTIIEYFGPNRKGSYDWLLSWLFQQQTADVVQTENGGTGIDFRVTLGQNADPCLAYGQGPAAD